MTFWQTRLKSFAPQREEARTANGIRLAAGGLSGAVGVLVLYGWAHNITALTQIVAGLSAMNPVTAASLIIAAAALVFHLRASNQTIWALGALVSLIGAAKLLQLAGGYSLNIDQIIFASKLIDAVGVPPNRMAPHTALALLLVGAALVSSKSRSPKVILISQGLSLLVSAICLFALIGYILGIVALYKLKTLNPMAVHTAFALLMTAIGVLSANSRSGLTPVISDRGPAVQLSRIVLPLAVLIPVGVGVLRIKSEEMGLYETGNGVALMVFGNVLVTFVLLLGSILLLHRSDLDRRRREVSVQRSEQEYRLAERLGRVGHWRLDVRTNQFACSTELIDICGLPRGSQPGVKDILLLHHAEDLARQRECTKVALHDGVGWDAAGVFYGRKGELRIIRSHGETEADESGQIISLFGVFVEITELEQSREQAEAATAAKASFLANMSHESARRSTRLSDLRISCSKMTDLLPNSGTRWNWSEIRVAHF